LKLEFKLLGPGSFTNHAQHECGELRNEQQHTQAVFVLAAIGAESQAEARAFQITKRLLDLHALGVNGHHRLKKWDVAQWH